MSQSNTSFSQPKSWELSLYELHRTPQEAITDDTEIAVSPRSLHSELMCPICLDMLSDTMTTKECLHRFCHDCIITALRAGNKECPTCRKKLISKRSLRRDPNFDSLIKKIYPDRDEYDAHQEKVMEKLNQHTNQQALTNSIEEGLKLQAQNRLQRALKQQQKQAAELQAAAAEQQRRAAEQQNKTNTEESDPPATSQESSSNEPATTDQTPSSSNTSSPTPQTSSHSSREKQTLKRKLVTENGNHNAETEELDDVELFLHPHPDFSNELLELQKAPLRYIKTTSNATVTHIFRYLSVRFQLDGSNTQEKRKNLEFSMFIRKEGDFVKLTDTLTLFQIRDMYWKENKPIELYFLLVE